MMQVMHCIVVVGWDTNTIIIQMMIQMMQMMHLRWWLVVTIQFHEQSWASHDDADDADDVDDAFEVVVS